MNVITTLQLAALKAIFLGYLRQFSQIDQTYARRMLDEEAPTVTEAKDFVGLVENVMNGTLMQLGAHKAIRRIGLATVDMEGKANVLATPESAKGAAA